MSSMIWEKCKKNEDVMKAERDAIAFLKEFGLEKEFNIDQIENWIYNCQNGEEDKLFNPILNKIKSGNLSDLSRFDRVFRQKLFSHVPHKVLGDLSPVKYTLMLKNMRDSKT